MLMAASCGFEQWQTDVRALIALVDQDGPEPRTGDGTNRISWKTTLDGVFDLQGTLTADLGLVLATAVNRQADELFHRYRRDHDTHPDLPVPTHSELCALALIELIRAANAADASAGRTTRPEVTVIRLADRTTDPQGRPIPAEAAGVWGCIGDTSELTVDDAGVPLHLGHAYRLATAAQRRALSVRDGGCAFPGCDLPSAWTDAHHLTQWDHGGPTDLPNLLSLCRTHHGIAHRTGWTVQLTDDGWSWWTSPADRTIWGQRHYRRRAGPTPDHPGHRPGIIRYERDADEQDRADTG